jgi:DNA-binding transcriptional LysR family regulator
MHFMSTPLRGFLEVARLGGVGQAARSLALTQPAVTKQIRALEAELQCSLLERAGRGVRLTAAGELLREHARRCSMIESDFEAALTDLNQGRYGSLRVGAGVTTAAQHLPPWLDEFRRGYPGVDVSIRTGTSRDVEAWVRAGEVELGFVTSEPQASGLQVKRLFEEEIVLVVERGHPDWGSSTSEELPLILFPKTSGFRNYLEGRLAARRFPFRVKMETDDVAVIKSLVAVGIGAAFLPASAVEKELRAKTLVRLEPPGLGKLRRRTALIAHGERTPSFAMQRFAEIVTRAKPRGQREAASAH